MSEAASVWFVLVAAFLAANLPFVTRKLFGVIALPGGKNLAIRLAELVVLYFAVGGIGLALEKRLGQIAPQGWEFYAVTAALFLTFAFPGFVWRYLYKRRH
ncbi:MAG TPA: DUF2818 family protein [Ramlibacter sp.]|uniref:DUF2818 family protein n=1 Tax=Ramlibacter sp. TaxID=1917967 RepID=UPI002D00C563|nr:DUF2818 family protein [Ramlibacter sp.]HVZ42916.1 DUF2818 family protein [Ramlibacter sp.]